MNVLYITNLRLPSDKANSIHISKMAEAFTGKVGYSNFKLLIPNRDQPKELKGVGIEEFCGLKRKINVQRVPVIDLFKYNDVIGFWVETLSFCVISWFFVFFSDFNIVYTRDFFSLPFLLLTGKRVYYECHYFPTNKIAIFMHKLLLPKLAGIVTITGQFKKYFDDSDFHYKKLLVAHDASDPDFFSSVDEKQAIALKKKFAPHGEVIVGYIGNLFGLGGDKGRTILLHAFETLRKSQPRAKLLMVGNSDLAEENGVVTTGRIPYKDMPIYHRIVDIAVIPLPDRPHFRYFTSPLKLFDYLAAGKPIVASDLEGLREVLTKRNAIFVKPDDPQALAGGIDSLVKENDLRLKMGHENAKLAKQYTWDKRAVSILDFIA